VTYILGACILCDSIVNVRKFVFFFFFPELSTSSAIFLASPPAFSTFAALRRPRAASSEGKSFVA
jgi:hypothetical protein